MLALRLSGLAILVWPTANQNVTYISTVPLFFTSIVLFSPGLNIKISSHISNKSKTSHTSLTQ
jgi:hypothetical protein